MPKNHKYTCDYCGKTYKVKNTLVNHFLKYHPHKLKKRILLPCTYCKNYFAGDITLRKAHILQFHRAEYFKNKKEMYMKQKRDSSFICNYCNSKFYIKTHLIAHIRNIHIRSEKSDKKYCCEMCQSYFKTQGWLGRHILKCHVNTQDEIPDDKDKEVKDVMSNLKILNAQSDILACAIGASELDFGNVNVEMQNTAPQSDILAQAIGTTRLDFVPNVDISKLEILKENGTKVIKCGLCKFKANSISLLKRHMISHSTAKQYQCPHCPTKCGYLYNLKEHIIFKHNNNNIDTKKKSVKKKPIKNGENLNISSLPILFENSNMSIDDSILNDMLKDIPSDMELPTNLIDIDNVLINSELVTPVTEIPIIDEKSINDKESGALVNKFSVNTDLNAVFKIPVGHVSKAAVNALHDHTYSSKIIVETSEDNFEINKSNVATCNVNEATDTACNAVPISNKLIEIPDSSDIIIEDLLDLAEISDPDPLANVEHLNTSPDDNLMSSSFVVNDDNLNISQHTSNLLNKKSPKVVILKNELICPGRQSVPPINVVNDYIIYGKDSQSNYLNNINEVFPNTVFTPSIETFTTNFTTYKIMSKGIATDLVRPNVDATSLTHNLENTLEPSKQNVVDSTNAHIITDTEFDPSIGAFNSMEDENIVIDTSNNNIHNAYELKANSTASKLVEDINIFTNEDMPTIDQCVSFDLDVILSSDFNKQVTVEQIKSIFGNTPESNHSSNVFPLDKENTPPPQPVPDDLTKDTDYIYYDSDDIIGALENAEQYVETKSVPLSNILACDPKDEVSEEVVKNAIANEVMCSDGNTEELVLKLLSQDTIKTLSNAKYGIFCEICNKTFRRVRNLREHIQLVHNKQEYTCDICGKTLHSYKYLKVHIQSHSGKVQCKVCGIGIATTSLSIHMRKHNNKKPYICALCGLSFATFSKKKYHILRCHLRSDTTSTKSSLMDMINEINEPIGDDVAVPQVITSCVNAILEKQRQYKPVARERGVKQKEYECKYCKKVFNVLFNYKRHLETHNKEETNKNNRPRTRKKKAS